MMDKPWYKSKTIWTAIVAAGIGVAQAFGVMIPVWVFSILGALGLYSVRAAIGSNG